MFIVYPFTCDQHIDCCLVSVSKLSVIFMEKGSLQTRIENFFNSFFLQCTFLYMYSNYTLVWLRPLLHEIELPFRA